MNDIDQIKQKLDIVDLIGEYIPLKKTGANFKALCPFHNEKSPSFVVSRPRQIWHCFGCGKGGDIFTFFMEYDHLGFGEAIKILAERAGVKLTQSAYKDDLERKKEYIYSVNQLASKLYSYFLLEHKIGKAALDYLTTTRGLPIPLIKKFGIGYAPSGNQLSTYLQKKKDYKIPELLDTGLFSQKNSNLTDFFWHRIMFPLEDVRGNILGFSGRALDNKTLPKYVNTRETLVYKKGDTLFGIQFAKDSIKKDGKVILVEGEFDVISSFHEGIENVVAIKGTALTENQIKLLKRYAAKIVFCLDTDPAGTAAQQRSIELIEKEGIASSVVIPSGGKDPDELLRTDPAAFKIALKHEVNIYDFVINAGIAGKDLNNPEEKRKVVEKTLPPLLHIDNEVVKEHYLKKLAEVLDTSLESLLRQGEKMETPIARRVEEKRIAQKDPHEQLEEYFLGLILQSDHPKKYCARAFEILNPISLSLPAYQRLFTYLNEFPEQTVPFSLQGFAATLPQEIIEVFDHCCLIPLPQFKDEEEYFHEIEKKARDIKTIIIKRKLQQITKDMKEYEGNEDELLRLHKDYQSLTNLLK